jgi:hypothetical protein
VGGPQREDVERVVVLAKVDDHLAALVVGVQAVEDPAGLDFDPADVAAAIAGQPADPSLVVRVPDLGSRQ